MHKFLDDDAILEKGKGICFLTCSLQTILRKERGRIGGIRGFGALKPERSYNADGETYRQEGI